MKGDNLLPVSSLLRPFNSANLLQNIAGYFPQIPSQWGGDATSTSPRGLADKDKSPAEESRPSELKHLALFAVAHSEDLIEAPKTKGPGHLLKNAVDVGPSEDILVRIVLPELAVSGLSELLSQCIILSPFFLVGEHCIRLVQSFHFFGCRRIPGIPVRMVLESQFPVRLSDRVLIGIIAYL